MGRRNRWRGVDRSLRTRRQVGSRRRRRQGESLRDRSARGRHGHYPVSRTGTSRRKIGRQTLFHDSARRRHFPHWAGLFRGKGRGRRRRGMISVWWLLAAFWLGGILG